MGGDLDMVLSENGTKRIIQLDKNELVRVDNYRQSVYNKYSSVSNEHISTVSGQPILQYFAKSASFNLPQDLTWTWYCAKETNEFAWKTWPTTGYLFATLSGDNDCFTGAVAFPEDHTWSIMNNTPSMSQNVVAMTIRSCMCHVRKFENNLLIQFFETLGGIEASFHFESNWWLLSDVPLTISKGWYAV